jgi:hypothetical protein
MRKGKLDTENSLSMASMWWFVASGFGVDDRFQPPFKVGFSVGSNHPPLSAIVPEWRPHPALKSMNESV